MEEKNVLKKIMIDYVRWVFSVDFRTPRYMIYRELFGEIKDRVKYQGEEI